MALEHVQDSARLCSGSGHSAYVADDSDTDEAREVMTEIYATLPTGDHQANCPWCDRLVTADVNGILYPH